MKSLDYKAIKDQMSSLQAPKVEISILLDRPHSDMNIAHVFRLCDAAQIEHLYILNHNPAIKWRKVVQLSRKNTNYVSYSLLEAPCEMHQFDEVIGLEWTDESQDIYSLSAVSKSLLLIVGNEQMGISQELLDKCHNSIHLPMYGQHSSINMAMATGIATYHLQGLPIKP